MAKRKRNAIAANAAPSIRTGDAKSSTTENNKLASQNSHKAAQKSSIAAISATNNNNNEGKKRKVLKTEQHQDVKSEFPVIQIVTGSYERVLHGITATVERGSGEPSITFADSFLFNAHASAIKCLALSPLPEDSSQGILLATGGSDERVNIYSLSTAPMPESDSKGRKVPSMPSLGPNKISENPANRELGTLVQHSSNITALRFPSRSKLLSSSEDNTVSITRVKDLEVVSTIKAPRPKVSGQASGDISAVVPAGVNDFAIHPSMKLMVSVGRGEKCMRLWNLVTGKKAGVLNFERQVLEAVKEGKYSHGEGRRIVWNKAGTEFAVAFERGVVIYGQDSKAKCVLMPKRLTKVHQIGYLTVQDRELLAVSTDDGKLLFFDSTTKSDNDLPVFHPIAFIGGDKQGIRSRLKDFQILDMFKHGYNGLLVVVGCSNGDIRLITIDASDLQNPQSNDDPIGEPLGQSYETGNRITCLVAFPMFPPHDIDGGLSEAESINSETEDESDDD